MTAITEVSDAINEASDGTKEASDAINEASDRAFEASVVAGKPQKVAKNTPFTPFAASSVQNETVFEVAGSWAGWNAAAGVIQCLC